jgi:hypothetical protein
MLTGFTSADFDAFNPALHGMLPQTQVVHFAWRGHTGLRPLGLLDACGATSFKRGPKSDRIPKLCCVAHACMMQPCWPCWQLAVVPHAVHATPALFAVYQRAECRHLLALQSAALSHNAPCWQLKLGLVTVSLWLRLCEGFTVPSLATTGLIPATDMSPMLLFLTLCCIAQWL